MDSIGKVHQIIWSIAGHNFVVNYYTMLNTLIVSAVILIFAFFGGRSLKLYPGRFQSLVELLIGSFDTLVNDTLGEKGRKYFSLVMTMFIYVVACNWIGIIPFLEEPTADVNTTVALGIIAFLVAQISALFHKGFIGYIKDFFEPMIVIGGVSIPNVLFAPLNLIGEVAKLVSHSFRLFGNIMGGGIIIIVVSSLVHYLVLPIFLDAFFGLFVGAVQAFVFAMLALVYIAIGITE